MNQDILQRAMFAMPLSKEARNTGIMQGFEDEMDMGEEDMGDEMMPMERTPQNPEILMNNLRGDMRSVDARYMELANMVGEQAAMETPPEVLAILQDHFAMMEQPQGIGALPQGAGMAPPGMMPPDQMAQGPMPMDQGAGMPPAGMEGMPPFPQGGSEGAPPTPDGLPPAQMAIGGVASLAARFAPYMAATGAALRGGISRFNQAANQYLGNVLFPGGAGQRITQPFLESVRGPGGRYTAQQTAQGGQQIFPTMTQGFSQLMAQNPMLRSLTGKRAMGIAGLGGLAMYGQSGDEPAAAGPEIRMTPEGVPYGKPTDEMTAAGQAMFPPLVEIPKPSEAAAAGEPAVATETPAASPAAATPIDIWEGVEKQPDWITQAISAPPKTEKADRMARIRKGTEEYKALFKDIIGSDDDMKKANAWFLLADAGLKLASTAEPTLAMSIGKSFAGLPAGLAKIASEARANDVKISTSALNAAVGDIEGQEKFARDLYLKQIEAQGKLQQKLMELMAKEKPGVYTDLGVAGFIRQKDDKGNVTGYRVDVNDPVLSGMINNENTLTAASPFVKDLGPGTGSVLQGDKERTEKVIAVNAANQGINVIDQMIGIYQKAFGPKAGAVNFANNWIIPLTPIDPVWEDRQRSIDMFNQRKETLRTLLARMEREGRTAVQQEKWAEEAIALQGGAWLDDPTVALNRLLAARAGLLNKRQDALGQLVPLPSNLMAGVPPSGSSSSPFDLTGENKDAVLQYLQSFSQKAPAGMQVHVRMPNGAVTLVSVSQFARAQ